MAGWAWARAVVVLVAAAITWPAGAVAQQAGASGKAPKQTSASAPKQTGSLAMPQPGQGPLDNPHILFYRQLALIHGHLLVGNELVREDRWEEALPHFLHSADAAYAPLMPYLKAHAIRPFDAQMKALAQAAGRRNKEAYDAARLFAYMALERAFDGARKSMTPMRTYTLRTVVEVLKVAHAEYQSAMQADGRIGVPIAYQNGRGFAYHAHQMFETIAPDLEATDRDSVDAIRWTFVELKSAWPTLNPPEKPRVTPEAVASRVTRIADLTAKFE